MKASKEVSVWETFEDRLNQISRNVKYQKKLKSKSTPNLADVPREDDDDDDLANGSQD
jgi:hypothetical protein